VIKKFLDLFFQAEKRHDAILAEIEQHREMNRKTIEILKRFQDASILKDELWFDCECVEMPIQKDIQQHHQPQPTREPRKYIVRNNEVVMKNA
jgi:hypothetical protein